MIDLGATDFFIDVTSLPHSDFEKYSNQLFDVWVNHVDNTLNLSDYSISLEIEEGSVKGKGKIAIATLGALYIGIGQYGSFVSGLQTIRDQVVSSGNFLAEHSSKPFDVQDHEIKVRKYGGALGQLQRLFNKVQNREMTAEEAMREAENFLGEEAATNPEFMQELKKSLEEIPRHPEQLPLLEPTEQDVELSPLDGEKKKRSRSPSPIPMAPPPNQLRVEVWRDTKKGQKKIRIIQL
jgi:hypothetical protein